MKTKLLTIASLLLIAIAMGLVVVAVYWKVYPYQLLTFNESPFKVGSNVVKAGGVLTYTSNYCKYTDLPVTVSRTFQNAIVFSTPTEITNRPTGCHTISIQVNVPSELPPGNYHLVNVYQYPPNPLRIITIQENTEEFTVTN